jgi:hypothetical protein
MGFSLPETDLKREGGLTDVSALQRGGPEGKPNMLPLFNYCLFEFIMF